MEKKDLTGGGAAGKIPLGEKIQLGENVQSTTVPGATARPKRDELVRITIEYVGETSKGNKRNYMVLLTGRQTGAIIFDEKLKAKIEQCFGGKPTHGRPRNGLGPFAAFSYSGGEGEAPEGADDLDAAPDCCVYVNGQWVCWEGAAN
jgi:hypothetical protein